MVMTADLDWSVVSVYHGKRDRRSILIKDNLARSWKNLARYHDHVLLDCFDSLCDLHSYPLFSDQPFNASSSFGTSKPTITLSSTTVTGLVMKPSFCSSKIAEGSFVMSRSSN